MKKLFKNFWAWYERHYILNIGIAAFLFVWQLVHLYWLGAHVMGNLLFGRSFFFDTSEFWHTVLVLVDYTEIPALITTSVVYINELRKRFTWKSIAFLIMLNSQWLHLFWITDTFVIRQFEGSYVGSLPVFLAWIAILIDYLEVPVIIDTFKKFFKSLKGDVELKEVFKEE